MNSKISPSAMSENEKVVGLCGSSLDGGFTSIGAPPLASKIDTAPMYRALENARIAMLALGSARSGATISAVAEIDAILNAAPDTPLLTRSGAKP